MTRKEDDLWERELVGLQQQKFKEQAGAELCQAQYQLCLFPGREMFFFNS